MGFFVYDRMRTNHRPNLLRVEEQELGVFLTNVLYVDFAPRSKCDVHSIALPQLDGIVTDVNLDRSARSSTSIVTGPLDEMDIDIGALSSMGEGSGGR